MLRQADLTVLSRASCAANLLHVLDIKLTSIVKQPPDVYGSFALFLLELLTGLQQTLVGQTQRRLGVWSRRHDVTQGEVKETLQLSPVV